MRQLLGAKKKWSALHTQCLAPSGERKSKLLFFVARAKWERVVQDGVEKANRRHGTARPTRHPSLLIWNLTISDEIPYLKMSNFRRKLVKLGRTPYLKTDHFRRNFVKIGEIEAHSLFENWQFSTKISENLWNWGALLIWKLAVFEENWWKSVKLRRTPYLKTCIFRRKLVKLTEIEAHFLFEN